MTANSWPIVGHDVPMRFAAARLFVDSLERSIGWYQTLFGEPKAVTPAVYAVFRAGEIDVIVEEVPADAPAEDRALVGRFSGVSFAVGDLVGEFARLTAAGVSFSDPPEEQAWGGMLASLADPAGNEIQLVEYPVQPWANAKQLTSLDPPHAVEQLVFEVSVDAYERWLAADFELWTVAEADQFPDFLSKEVWVRFGDTTHTVVVVIHWTTLASWKSVDMAWVDAQEARFSQLVGPDSYRLVHAPHLVGEQYYKVSDYR